MNDTNKLIVLIHVYFQCLIFQPICRKKYLINISGNEIFFIDEMNWKQNDTEQNQHILILMAGNL